MSTQRSMLPDPRPQLAIFQEKLRATAQSAQTLWTNRVATWQRRAQAHFERRQDRAILAGRLDFAVARLPPAAAIRGWYACAGDVQALRRAIDTARPHALYGINSVLKDICSQGTVNASMARSIRVWLDAMLGAQDNLVDAKTACKRLFLLQHEDKVGKRDFGSILYQRHADEFWDLLKTTRALLAHRVIAPMLYGGAPLGLRLQRRLAVSAGILVGLMGLSCLCQGNQSHDRLTQ